MKDMSKAPKDGRWILVYTEDQWEFAFWDREYKKWVDRNDDDIGFCQGWSEVPQMFFNVHHLWLLKNVKDWQKGSHRVWRTDHYPGYSFSKPQKKQSIGEHFVTTKQWNNFKELNGHG